jgi:hypothetical protein
MATCEEGPKARLFLWDLQEGKRLAVLQPHAERYADLTCNQLISALLATVSIQFASVQRAPSSRPLAGIMFVVNKLLSGIFL